MTTTTDLQPDFVVSTASDLNDLPLDAEADISHDEYARIMHRITIGDGSGGDDGADTEISAFNSSI